MSDLTAKLEKAGKIVGAAGAIIAATGALSGWAFTTAMANRDREAVELREDIDALKTQLRELSTNSAHELEGLDEDFDDLRMALIALRAEMTFRTSSGTAPTPTVTLRRRVTRSRPLLSIDEDAPPAADLPPGAGYAVGTGRMPPSLPQSDVIELDSAHSAEAAYNDALGRMDDL